MITTFGSRPDKMPEGFFKAVRIPVLMLLDKETTDGRLFDSAGAGVRSLPFQLAFQYAALPAHMESKPSGTIFEVTMDPDSGMMSARGFLLDDEVGRLHARMIATQAQDRNSVDLADVKAHWEIDLDTGEERIRFTKFNVAKTTGVAVPAFDEAHAQIDDEIMASIMQDPMDELVASCEVAKIHIVGAPQPEQELVADGVVRLPFADFYVPEADRPTKIVITEDHRIYGHLSLWDDCHDGIEGQCVITPRPRDGYASFNQAGPLTDRGQVETGPIFFLGGHRPLAGTPSLAEAYGGIENAFADVRVVEGRLGPWLSGRVRPGVSEESIHMARCSKISGHWKGDRLLGIVCVNVPGFNVPGSGASDAELELAAGFAFHVNDDGVSELVASFPACSEDDDPELAEALARHAERRANAVDPPVTIHLSRALSPEAIETITVQLGQLVRDGVVDLSVDVEDGGGTGGGTGGKVDDDDDLILLTLLDDEPVV